MNNKMQNQNKIDSSISSVMRITIPILLTSLSTCSMLLIDRFMLAGYSLESMSAASISGNFISIFSYMLIGITSSAEIYVGQYNGSKQYAKLASPTWQMLYLSIFSMVIFLPVAYFSEYCNTLPSYFLEEGIAYQRPLMYFGVFQGIITALSSFFIGQGKTKIVTNVVICGTITNVILDYFFIYKFHMKCHGAAIATIIAEAVQILILATVFFNKKNIKHYKTFLSRKFDSVVFWGCIKLGTPMAVGNFISMIAWYVAQVAVSNVSKDQATVYNICVSIYMFFIFLGDGLSKSISTISSNMIAQNDAISIHKTYRLFIIIGCVFSFSVSIFILLFPDLIFQIFNIINMDVEKLVDIRFTFVLIAVGIILETSMLTTCGVLHSGGDIKYPVIVNQSLIWSLVVFPTIVLYNINLLDVNIVFELCILWLSVSLFLLQKRYKSMLWYNKLV